MATLTSSQTSSPPMAFWLRRYVPMEMCGLLLALLCGSLVAGLTHNPVVIATTSAWCASAGYYGWVFVADLRRHTQHNTIGRSTLTHTLRALALEFGPAEILDAALVRPMLVMAGMRASGHTQLGIVLGGLAADAVFYALVVALRRLAQPRLACPQDGLGPVGYLQLVKNIRDVIAHRL